MGNDTFADQATGSKDECFFGPEALKRIDQAFEQAWHDIAADYQSPASIVEARRRLAKLIFDGARAVRPLPEADALKEAALRNMRGL